MLNLIKEKIQELYRNKSNNVKFIGYGYKNINNQITDIVSITFAVDKKLPLNEIPESQIIPSAINIGNDFLATDVIESPIDISPFNECYVCDTYSSSSNDMSPNRSQYNNVKAGVSIGQYDSTKTGTLGLIVVDNDTNKLVGLTAAHVLVDNMINVAERTQEPVPYNIMNKQVLHPGRLDDDDQYIQNSIGMVKRYYPVSKLSSNNNYIDAAVFSVSNIDTSSIECVGLNNTESIPFATTLELDNLVKNNNNFPIYKSGRSSGFIDCPMTAKYVGVSVIVHYDYASITYDDTIVFTYDLKENNKYADNVYCPGDSGQAIIANINGVNKIIGIAIAGGSLSVGSTRNFAVVSRIDKIGELLNISYWDGTSINTSGFDSWTYAKSPISQSSSDPYVIQDGKKYWQIGTSYYDSTIEDMQDQSAQNSSIYGLFVAFNADTQEPAQPPSPSAEPEPSLCACETVPEIDTIECLYRSHDYILIKLNASNLVNNTYIQYKLLDSNYNVVENYTTIDELKFNSQILDIPITPQTHSVRLRLFVDCSGSDSSNTSDIE